ncbi:kelch repeat-containing protein [uncultured Algibacter sp.]|uniref:Kelch repeat-containing protein n=1 Tax=uncultured Algibacter sp. TaxID=298659 RepID=UPI002613CE5A|nr:kelch repeat-containing protein [uncultured Algibacter sp.]
MKLLEVRFFCCLFLISGLTFSQNVEIQGKWETIKTVDKPVARHENSFVRVKSKFYLLGGRGIKPISIYNTKTNTWTKGAKSPIEIHHFQAVNYKSNIYVFGAMTGKYPYEKPLSNILIYNPKKNIWTIGVEIPEARRRGSSGVVVQNNKAYIISGIVDGHNSTHVPWVDVYNFKTKTWSVLTDAPRPRDHFHAAIYNGNIYAVGGRNSSYATNQTFHLTIPEVDVFNIKTNSWTTLSEKNNIKTQRAGTSCVFLNDDLVLIGGESMSQNEAHHQVDAYNVKTKTWRKLKSLNRGRHGSQAIVYKNSIYIVAGSGNRGGKPELDSMEKFTMK